MIFALILLALLQVADVWTTSRFKAHGLTELNPIVRYMWERFGFWTLIAGKTALTAGIIAYALTYPGPFAWIVVGVSAGLTLLVVINNIEALSDA